MDTVRKVSHINVTTSSINYSDTDLQKYQFLTANQNTKV